MRERLGPWAGSVAWAGLILAATTVPLPASPLGDAGFPFDKIGHVALYLGLGWNAGRALLHTDRFRPAAAALAWLGGLGFAALDELHQGWVPTRVPSVGDWAADGLGLALGLAALAAWLRFRPGTGRTAGRTPSTRDRATDAGPAGVGRGAPRHSDGEDPSTDE